MAATPSSREMALHAARKMADKGAERLTVLEMAPERGCLYDFVVIGDGRSERQAHTLANEVHHFCKRHGIAHAPVEGEAGWYVVDCHDVVVHAFLEESRDYFQLDELWADATVINWEQELADLPDPDLDEVSGQAS